MKISKKIKIFFFKFPQNLKKNSPPKKFQKSFQKKFTYLWQRQKACLRERD